MKTPSQIVFISILVLGLIGCKTQNDQFPTITDIPSITARLPTQLSTIESAQEIYPATITPPRITAYQLTFVSEGQYLYGKNVTCIEIDHLCLGEEKILLSLQEKIKPSIPIGAYDWSPDGQMIAICSTGTSGKPDIFWTKIVDVKWENITNSNIYECSPNWTPDSQRIIYEANSHELYGGHQIFSSNLNGIGKIPLLNIDKFGDEGQASLSPDGTRLAFIHSDDNGYYQIYIADLDGSNRIQLTDLPAHNTEPSFSPDGRWIVFHRQTDPNSATNKSDDSRNHIVIMNIETKEEITLISGKTAFDDFVSPFWAPFGDWIAFSSNFEGNYNIYVIGTNGKDLMNITSGSQFESNPRWRIYTELK